jgi:chemotaxis protein methyltransferase CheR
MPIADGDFEFLRQFMLQNSAMVLDADKAYLAETRLSALVHRESLSSIENLVQRLKLESYGPLQRKVVDALTNHETWFFRDLAPFELLRKELLPAVRERKGGAPIFIWSAASSTGQEAGSIGMLAREMWSDAAMRVRILGTDISAPVLERARAGRYSQLEVNRGLPAQMLARYFRREGSEWELSPEIRKMLEFRQLNLAEPWAPVPPMDIILLRNVLIYFTVETKRETLDRIYRGLTPGGCLILGAAETTLGLHDGYERVLNGRCSYYRKPLK